MGQDSEIWMTYVEAAKHLGIKPDSVRRRAASRKWPRRQGNDGLARVCIPPDVVRKSTPDVTHERTPAIPPDASASKIAALEVEIREVRVQLEDIRADRDAWRAQAERLASETRPAGFLARLFGR